ncbi:MAG: S8 family serine peptidase [Solirubrobacterales bacterium]|nr:S8 family serine peptidase [Solirubrobacterales bacterium]MBV9472359.1 S8 family serine peptidase [Solirubrobacterales bacterium]
MRLRPHIPRLAAALTAAVALLAGDTIGGGTALAADYVPGVVIVGYSSQPAQQITAAIAMRMGARAVGPPPAAHEQLLRLAPGQGVMGAIARLRREPGVAFAVPDFIAHATGPWYPNDRGSSHRARGWEAMQWNFLPAAGVNAPGAWGNLLADHRPGGRGVVVAVLDTGVAYRDWHQFRKSPDFGGTRFVAPYDFIEGNRFPLDRNGHGTVVAGVVAEATNNGFGLTGLAYGAAVMPVRVLDDAGDGDEVTIARGIRYAVAHGAQVINLSLEFSPDEVTSGAAIPDIVNAISFAHTRGVVVVASAGNDRTNELAYPARAPAVISVGATTRDRCLAQYSNGGAGLDLVAPGGGPDAYMPGDHDCHPNRSLPPVYQLTLLDPQLHPDEFGYPGIYIGTSMSAPEVAATAALVIASRVLGPHPTPDQILQRLEQTAEPLGDTIPNESYGYGLLDAAAATARP